MMKHIVESSDGNGITDLAQCARCCGNGEIITDWDRYLDPWPGDVGAEAIADCPDCSGTGRLDNGDQHE